MRKIHLAAGGVALAALSGAGPAAAHAVVGNRFFPATLATDDPGVADELSLPVIGGFRPGDDPAARKTDVSGEWSKRLTSDFGVSFAGTWTRLKAPDGGGTARGFQNLETTAKYQALTSVEHEAIVAVGLSYEWGGTGSTSVGAERHSTVTPQVFFGKGAGDLPESLAWARPFALTGVVGYAMPTRSREDGERLPQTLTYGFALEYSLPYMASHVRDLDLPPFVNHLTPVVEASFETDVAHGASGATRGTVNPGLIWSGRHVQLGAEATLPINRESGRGAGFLLQVHFFLDDLFPHGLGKPIW
jgi:hypothetical protein